MATRKDFTSAVDAWTRQTQERLTAVFRTAVQDVANQMREVKPTGNMPFKTGNLRRSLMASTESMPPTGGKDDKFADAGGQVTLTIAQASIGDTIHLGFQAAYARRMEYGFVGKDSLGRTYNQEGNGFVRKTAQRWPRIVQAAANKVRQRVEE